LIGAVASIGVLGALVGYIVPYPELVDLLPNAEAVNSAPRSLSGVCPHFGSPAKDGAFPEPSGSA
jgi:hypothetical protein